MRTLQPMTLLLVSACEVLAGCGSAAVMRPSFSQAIEEHPTRAVDVLFLMDDLYNGDHRQFVVAQNIPRFIQALDVMGADYHIGIASSEVGTLTTPGTPWSIPAGPCNSYAGDDGSLQGVPCTTRTEISNQAASACNSLCPDPSYVPSDGTAFISVVGGVNNIKSTDPLAPQKAFQCMALLGDAGCNISGQLEGAKRALDGHNPHNNGFLRDGSLLTVIYLTFSDDCSVSLARRDENNPVTMDCPTPDQSAAFNCYNVSYRCIARDLTCDQPLNEAGTKTGCTERPDSYLEPISTYVDFLQSLRASNRLVVSGIWSPPIDANLSFNESGQFIAGYVAGGTQSYDLFRDEGMLAACYDLNDSGFYSHPQLRLSKFIAGLGPNAIQNSVCETENYPIFLDQTAAKIKAQLGATVACLDQLPLTRLGQPACTVSEVNETNLSSPSLADLPACGTACCAGWATSPTPSATDATVQAACGHEPADCYCVVVNPLCTTALAGVWRKSGTPPPNLAVRFQCELP